MNYGALLGGLAISFLMYKPKKYAFVMCEMESESAVLTSDRFYQNCFAFFDKMDFSSSQTYIISNAKVVASDSPKAQFVTSGETFIKRCESIFEKITRNSYVVIILKDAISTELIKYLKEELAS